MKCRMATAMMASEMAAASSDFVVFAGLGLIKG